MGTRIGTSVFKSVVKISAFGYISSYLPSIYHPHKWETRTNPLEWRIEFRPKNLLIYIRGFYELF
jgi:hypothetical protein